MDILERVWGLLTNFEWVSDRQSYRLSGPPNSFSSAEVSVSRGKLVPSGDADEALEELKKQVKADCVKQMPEVIDTLSDMVEEYNN